jgi:hypothetical protein
MLAVAFSADGMMVLCCCLALLLLFDGCWEWAGGKVSGGRTPTILRALLHRRMNHSNVKAEEYPNHSHSEPGTCSAPIHHSEAPCIIRSCCIVSSKYVHQSSDPFRGGGRSHRRHCRCHSWILERRRGGRKRERRWMKCGNTLIHRHNAVKTKKQNHGGQRQTKQHNTVTPKNRFPKTIIVYPSIPPFIHAMPKHSHTPTDRPAGRASVYIYQYI